ncbi:unnamed protein product [marine sediment metagenome]|uniref:Uncharacterized protein n=1 Tax=marine sediment metagenome TaxID=412755 RepID=X0URG1_9ZZZZ
MNKRKEIDILKIIQNELKGKISDLRCLFENHYHKDLNEKIETIEKK